MARFILYGITCQDNQEGEDEVYMQARVDNEPWHDVWSSDMNTGNARSIVWSANYYNRIRIKLWESDGAARAAGCTGAGDDELGNFELTVPPNDTGVVEVTLTARVGAQSTTYKFSYEVMHTSGSAATRDWITLLRLHCNDAKGIRDQVYMTRNNAPFWGPLKMKTGDDRIIRKDIELSGQNVFQLWEKDSSGNNDSLGSASITAQSYGTMNSAGEYQAQFSWRRSSTRDSLYTLFFIPRDAPAPE